MKKLLTFVLTAVTLLAGSNVFAQGKWGADSAECILYVSYYRDYFHQKSYDDAMRNWRQAYKLCPASASYNLLVDGGTLVKNVIKKNARNAEYKKALIDTLMTIYDQRAEFFPKQLVTSLNNKGADLHNLVKNDSKYLHDGFAGIIDALQEKVRPTILLYDYQALVDLYQAGNAEASQLIEAYQKYGDILSKVAIKTSADSSMVSDVKNGLGSLFASSQVATCENLVEIFTPRLEADPDNVDLATSIVRTMNLADDCAGEDLYLKAVTVMHANNPSSASAYALYKLNANSNDVAAAIRYLEEALAYTDLDAATRAEYTYQLAAYCFKSGRNAQAFEAAKKVPELDPSLAGKAYFLIGTIWGQARCGGNEVTGRANYWVAVDYFAKARAADESLAEEAQRYISRFSAFYPSVGDAFMYGYQKGQGFTASCGGMTASTTVKTQ